MKINIKIWHFILSLCLIIFIIQVREYVDSVILFIVWIKLFFSNFSFAIGQINFPLVDRFLSTFLIVLIPFYIYKKKSKNVFINNKLNFTSATIIVLLSFFIFAPIIAVTNPDFQKNLNVTKLLPPLSKVKVLYLKEETGYDNNEVNDFLKLKDEVIKKSFENSIIFIDSLRNGQTITYFQKGRTYNIEKDKVQFSLGQPVVESKTFLLGSDEFGRDIFSRLVYGTRISLFVGLCAVAISLILGLSLGFIAGFFSGPLDVLLNRFTDMLLAFPMIFLIILILALFGNNLMAVIFVLGFSGWMSLFKIVRSEVISIKNKEYFITSKMLGLSKSNLLIKEILPVIAASVIVNLVFQYGNVILAEAALSFLGLGTGSSYPSWGQMIEAGQVYLTSAWWMIVFPGLILFLTLFAAYNFGRESSEFFNPRIKV
ncbi:MAG: ABC transporter permease [Ignavibacteriaceae bacterium]